VGERKLNDLSVERKTKEIKREKKVTGTPLEVFMSVLKMVVLWAVTRYSFVARYRCFTERAIFPPVAQTG
jgi:hypothetical protein